MMTTRNTNTNTNTDTQHTQGDIDVWLDAVQTADRYNLIPIPDAGMFFDIAEILDDGNCPTLKHEMPWLYHLAVSNAPDLRKADAEAVAAEILARCAGWGRRMMP